MKIEQILNEIRITTIGIYYKQFKELSDYISSLEERTGYIIFCQMHVLKQTKRIGQYFKVKVKGVYTLPEDTLFCVANEKYMYPSLEEYNIGE